MINQPKRVLFCVLPEGGDRTSLWKIASVRIAFLNHRAYKVHAK